MTFFTAEEGRSRGPATFLLADIQRSAQAGSYCKKSCCFSVSHNWTALHPRIIPWLIHSSAMPAGMWNNPSREREECAVSQRRSGPARGAGEQSYLQGVLSNWIPADLTFTWGAFDHISFICLGSQHFLPLEWEWRHKKCTVHCFQQMQTCWMLWGVMKDDVRGDDRPSAKNKQSSTENVSFSSCDTQKFSSPVAVGRSYSREFELSLSDFEFVHSCYCMCSQKEANHEIISCILSLNI